MRYSLVLVGLSLLASPALAQNVPPPRMPPPQMALPPVPTDPATIDRMSDAAEAVSQALLDMPVGELRAAIKGRQPTPRDRHDTLGGEAGVSAEDVHSQFEAAKPMIARGANAMARALPVIMRSLAQVQGSIDRAMANMPDPNYPNR